MKGIGLLRAAATVGGLTALSRVTGLVRDVAMAALLGAGPIADAFFLSFKLANFLRRLFAEGAFAAGFTPMFASLLEREGLEAARRFAERALAALATILLVIVLLAQAFMPAVVSLLAPGFETGSERWRWAVDLSRITFPYILLVSATALIGAALNALGKFAAAAFAPVLLNLCLISAMAFAWAAGWPAAWALAWGVAAAGVAQLAFLWRSAQREGLILRPTRPTFGGDVARLWMLVLPGAFGAGVAQVNLLVDSWFASTIPGAISWLFYADRLNQLPLGMIGIALGTALLPLMSRHLASGAREDAKRAQSLAVETAMLLTLPAAAALIATPASFIEAIFERGAFDASDTAAAAQVLRFLALGLPAYVAIKILAPAFFAEQDTRTPVAIAAIAVLCNIALIVALIGPMGAAGIALATALSNWLNALCLAAILARGGRLGFDRRARRATARAAGASLAMAAALLALDDALSDWPAIARVAALAPFGLAIYAAFAHLGGAVDLRRPKTLLGPR